MTSTKNQLEFAEFSDLTTPVLHQDVPLEGFSAAARRTLTRTRRMLWFDGELHHEKHLDSLVVFARNSGQGPVLRTEASYLDVARTRHCLMCLRFVEDESGELAQAAISTALPPGLLGTVQCREALNRLSHLGSHDADLEVIRNQVTARVAQSMALSSALVRAKGDELLEMALTLATLEGQGLRRELYTEVSLLTGDKGQVPMTIGELKESSSGRESEIELLELIHAERITAEGTLSAPVDTTTTLVARRDGKLESCHFGLGDQIDELAWERWGQPDGSMRVPAAARRMFAHYEGHRLLSTNDPLLAGVVANMHPQKAELEDGDDAGVLETAFRLFKDGVSLEESLVMARAF